MDLLAQLKALDQLVVSGQLVKAVQDYFHPEFYYLDPGTGQLLGKISKVAYTWDFVRQIQTVNAVVLNESLVGKSVSMSEFLFDFTQQNGEPMRVHEIIKREWKEGLVLREWYFVSEGYPSMDTQPIQQNRLTLEQKKSADLPAGVEPVYHSLISLQKGGLNALQLCLDIEHPQPESLELILHSPRGAAASLPAVQKQSNLQKVYNLQDLPELQDTLILGEWKLEIRNTTGTESGVLNWWALEFGYYSTDDLTKVEGIGPKIAA
ncbi:MAG: proprotein convertase P-domain-containing protein, partial [Phaeodactylibacter sp.]|nr:proprotein convertase P-domain-containing protein [Phaeodactylibacter sp.]